jgi:hypothetical protein
MDVKKLVKSDTFAPGELFIYKNGNACEIGMVKRDATLPLDSEQYYFCYYSTGDTAARTPVSHMFKLKNSQCIDAITLGGKTRVYQC